LYDTGTSIGFVNQTIFPTRNLLAFINDRLPIPKRLRAPQRQQIELPDQHLKTVLDNSDKVLGLDQRSDSKVLEIVLAEQSVASSPNVNPSPTYTREFLGHSEYSESEGMFSAGFCVFKPNKK